MLSYLLPHLAAQSLISSIPDVAEINQLCCLEENGQLLENVDRTLLALASGSPVLQKKSNTIGHEWETD